MPVANCRSLATEIAPYTFENCLVQYGQKIDAQDMMARRPTRNADLRAIQDYATSFSRWTEAYQALLADHARTGRRVALYGAGHLTCSFVNFHDLGKLVAFVVDDTPQKQGRYLPKCGVPVRPKETLDAAQTPLCLLGLSPEIEDKVIANNGEFVAAGGAFGSMFAASLRSVRKLLPQRA
jgi:hypothetical protein